MKDKGFELDNDKNKEEFHLAIWNMEMFDIIHAYLSNDRITAIVYLRVPGGWVLSIGTTKLFIPLMSMEEPYKLSEIRSILNEQT